MAGINEKPTNDFGRYCLMARRLSEAGVRYIQVNYTDNGNNPSWDQHSNMPKHMEHARATDKPVAALLQDLKQRGLLDDTLVVFATEFGRMPMFQAGTYGRDHNPNGFTAWIAGAGVKGGTSHGATDEFGFKASEDVATPHDFHATLLHLLGLDHEQLTYYHNGIQRRLTDVHGQVIREVLA